MFSWKKNIVICLLFTSIVATAQAETITSKPIKESTNAIKWWRDSAERIAIYREIFSMAENIIKQKVTTLNLSPHEWGVIFDVDETILNNSEWNLENDVKGHQQEWNDFAAKGISIKIAGAKKLIDAIHAMGGYVNFVSNRPAYLQKITEKNLRAQGLYFDQLLLDTSGTTNWNPDKNSRFIAIQKGKEPSKYPKQKIIAWFGDNIQDFPNLKQAHIHKENPEGSAFDKFGVTYFALPNPMYGSWEDNNLN